MVYLTGTFSRPAGNSSLPTGRQAKPCNADSVDMKMQGHSLCFLKMKHPQIDSLLYIGFQGRKLRESIKKQLLIVETCPLVGGEVSTLISRWTTIRLTSSAFEKNQRRQSV
jgi:hypothetical protein